MTIYVVFGPTASGKTKLALSLAERFHSPLLSIDSRKVYKGMDIGTNKLELLVAAKERGLTLLGVDLVSPAETVSAYRFRELVSEQLAALDFIPESLVIFGGTGLYLDSLLFGLPLGDAANTELREEISDMSVEQLQLKISGLDDTALQHMNDSDRKNPRRLQRVLERLSDTKTTKQEAFPVPENIRALFADATAYFYLPAVNKSELDEKIIKRVLRYADEGWLAEVKTLLSEFSQDIPGLSIMGYAEVVKFLALLEQEQTDAVLREVLERVALIHRQYAKRQVTWSKRYLRDLPTLYKDATYFPKSVQRLFYSLNGDVRAAEE